MNFMLTWDGRQNLPIYNLCSSCNIDVFFFSLETNSHVFILSFLFLQEVIYNLRVKYGAFMLTHRENVHFLPGDKPGNMYDFLLNLLHHCYWNSFFCALWDFFNQRCFLICSIHLFYIVFFAAMLNSIVIMYLFFVFMSMLPNLVD